MQAKVLIVDDDTGFVNEVERQVNKLSVKTHVFRCADVAAAEELLKKQMPEIIVVDMNLPKTIGKDVQDGAGMALVSCIRKQSCRAKIILITGETQLQKQDKYMDQGISEGAYEVVLKESSENYVKRLVKIIEKLAKLFILLDAHINQAANQRILVYNISNEVSTHLDDISSPCKVITINSIDNAIIACKKDNISVCVVGIEHLDSSGIEFFRAFIRHRKDIPVMVIGFGQETDVFQHIKLAKQEGATSCARFEQDNGSIQRALTEALTEKDKQREIFVDLIGSHPSLIKAIGDAEKSAKNNLSVLLVGESGTGKELIAQGIRKQANRTGAYVPVNCAELPEHLFENEIFGHKKGAYTGAAGDKLGLFEEANGGIIFLDEITELSVENQAKLLKIIENMSSRRLGSVNDTKLDVKVIAATNRNIPEMIKKGTFKNDLYQRLNVFQVFLPSLNERKSDIPLLVYHFLNKIGKENNTGVIGIEQSALQQLQVLDWAEGNVRELGNTMQRVIAHMPATKAEISLADLEGRLPLAVANRDSADTYAIEIPVALKFKEIELWVKCAACLRYLKTVLEEEKSVHFGGKEKHAVLKKMDIGESTFYDYMNKGLDLATQLKSAENKSLSQQEILKLFSIKNNPAIEEYLGKLIKRMLNKKPESRN